MSRGSELPDPPVLRTITIGPAARRSGGAERPRRAGGSVARRRCAPGTPLAARDDELRLKLRLRGRSERDRLLLLGELGLLSLPALTRRQELHAVGEDPDGLSILALGRRPLVPFQPTATGRPLVRKRAQASPLAPKTVTSK
jgi:hypothetical protein